MQRPPASAPPPLPDLAALDRHLHHYSYIGGHRLSAADRRLRPLVALPSPPGALPALRRWCCHLDALAGEVAPEEAAPDSELLQRLGLGHLQVWRYPTP